VWGDGGTGTRGRNLSYSDSPHEQQTGAHRLDLLRAAGQQPLLAHLPPSASGAGRCPGCHPEPMRFAQGKLREGSGSPDAEILRCAQDDSQDALRVTGIISRCLASCGARLEHG
jgi:hypothetical protein